MRLSPRSFVTLTFCDPLFLLLIFSDEQHHSPSFERLFYSLWFCLFRLLHFLLLPLCPFWVMHQHSTSALLSVILTGSFFAPVVISTPNSLMKLRWRKFRPSRSKMALVLFPLLTGCFQSPYFG